MCPPKPWRHGEVTALHDCRVFTVGRSVATSPKTGDGHTFYRIDSADWVNVVPVTPAGEDAATAAARELLEETGYRGGAPEPLCAVNPNPALFGNTCHSFVVRDAVRVGEIENGPTEETAVELIDPARLRGLLEEGAIDHALVVVALWRYLIEADRSG